MNSSKRNILYLVLISVALILFSSCMQEETWTSLPDGELKLSIGKINAETGTRATPSELPKPIAEQFKLKVQRSGSEHIAYEGGFVESLLINVGDYDITATYGENLIIGRDTPYYIGTAQATINKDQPSEVTIPCRVGNALVSVRFGRDEEELERFNRYYEDFGLLVKNGEYSMAIENDDVKSSIYFPAGTSPELLFYGTLKQDNGCVVSIALTHQSLPSVFNAADHAIVTLSLPDPESAIIVNIGKVELVESNLDETIPLSWLPVPSVTSNHNYNTQGVLMGTDLTFSNTYPEMTWEARVTNAQGDTVRKIVGTGELISKYADSEEWPYLPNGRYKAIYFLHSEGEVNKVSSREFKVEKPDLAITIGGYTSFDKYEEGDIESANALKGNTLYEPQIQVNVSPTLTKMSKYAYQLLYDFNGEEQTTTDNFCLLDNKDLLAQLDTYILKANIEFAGETVSAQRGFRITGIPFSFEPPTTSTWSKSGDVTDDGEYARMGRWSSGSQSMTYTNVALPAGLRLALDYKFKPNAGAVSTTFTIYASEQTLISGKADSYNNPTYEGVQEVTLSAAAINVRCHNSYGAGATGTDVYRVAMRYR